VTPFALPKSFVEFPEIGVAIKRFEIGSVQQWRSAISSSTKVMFSQPCTCCLLYSCIEASIKSIKDSPSSTLEHHRLPFTHIQIRTAFLNNSNRKSFPIKNTPLLTINLDNDNTKTMPTNDIRLPNIHLIPCIRI